MDPIHSLVNIPIKPSGDDKSLLTVDANRVLQCVSRFHLESSSIQEHQ